MNYVSVRQQLEALEHLLSKNANERNAEASKPVFFEQIEDSIAQKFEDDDQVISVHKKIEHSDDMRFILGVKFPIQFI